MDRAGSWLVRGSGFVIIASILGILLFILIEVGPLLGGAEVAVRGSFSLPGPDASGGIADDYRSRSGFLDPTGRITVLSIPEGETVLQTDALSGTDLLTTAAHRSGRFFTGTTSTGEVLMLPFSYRYEWNGDNRSVVPEPGEARLFHLAGPDEPVLLYDISVDPDGGTTVVAWTGGDRLTILQEREEESFLGDGEIVETRTTRSVPPTVSSLSLDDTGRHLFAGTTEGDLLSWDLEEGIDDAVVAERDGRAPAVTATTLLLGGRTLVVGRADGSIGIWFRVRDDGQLLLRRARVFETMSRPITTLTPSPRNKGFAAMDDSGRLGLFHSTSHRVLWTGEAPVPNPAALSFSPKADGLVVTGRNGFAELDLHNPHPEISLGALFGKVWYEGYEEPSLTWQSSSGTDDFEPKLSLVPLLVGSLKGTFYSLFLAIPLGVLGAMYASQFMHPSLRGVVKPAVEVMAALPSVVLGFLAGLWLAPRLEEVLGSMILLAFAAPLTAILTGLLFSQLPARIRHRLPTGLEAVATIGTLAVSGWLCLRWSAPFEQLLFGGPMKHWITDILGLPFDQRNAVVVGLGMGFAVIPIIFSVAEDAFSNVPRHLVAGSLALGANRWQTVTRVVLPTASPGVFSAIIIGFGRAVGETMIVLMATGNTPIMDWNPFNGFRTLSANIAVEIPEAPHGGTLYRTLFLAALLLFILTFAVNTVAELVRTHLRNRYANL